MKRAAILVTALVVGCSEPDRMLGGDQDMAMIGGNNDLTTGQTPDLKTNGDMTGNKNDLANPPNLKMEMEQPTQRTNDTTATAETIAIGDTLDGTIGDPTIDTPDVDFYKFNAAAGDVLKLTISARGDFQAAAGIQNADRTYDRFAAGLGAPDYTREFYIPTAGQYFVVITDWRNADPAATTFVGGAAFTYRFALEKVTVTPTAVTVPMTAIAGTLGADNEVRIYSFTTTAGQGYTG